MAKKNSKTKTKATTNKKSKAKSPKEKRDFLWLSLIIFFVVVFVLVLIYYMKQNNSVSQQENVQQEQLIEEENVFAIEDEDTSTLLQDEEDSDIGYEVAEEEEKAAENTIVTYTNLEIPEWHTTVSHQQVKNLGYTSSYNTTYGMPNWVAYELTRSEATSQEAVRKDKFMPDPKIKGKSAQNSDYKGSGYDKGHMAPAADMKWSQTVMDQSFYFTNICPQAPGLNRGSWKELEEDIRLWAIRDSALVIVCGPLFTQEPIRYIPETEVAIPDAFFKVVCSPYTLEPRAIAFVFPNNKAPKHPREYVVTIDNVEMMTGMDFLSQLPDEIENQIEKTSNYTLWE